MLRLQLGVPNYWRSTCSTRSLYHTGKSMLPGIRQYSLQERCVFVHIQWQNYKVSELRTTELCPDDEVSRFTSKWDQYNEMCIKPHQDTNLLSKPLSKKFIQVTGLRLDKKKCFGFYKIMVIINTSYCFKCHYLKIQKFANKTLLTELQYSKYENCSSAEAQRGQHLARITQAVVSEPGLTEISVSRSSSALKIL